MSHRHVALDLHPDMEVAVDAAKIAGIIIRAGYRRTHAVAVKAVGDIVTEVDIQADEAICEAIGRLRPRDRICSEESHDRNPSSAQPGGRLWIVDPLDGTSAFTHHVDARMPSVLIALEVEGVTQLGVVYFPLIDKWYYGALDKGSFGPGHRKLSTQWAPKSIRECWVEMNQYGDSVWETPDFRNMRDHLRDSDGARLVTIRPPYSGVAAYIAEGPDIAAVVHDNNPHAPKPKQCLWDVAAPKIILEEAGGCVLNLVDLQRYNPRRPQPFIAAATGGLASQMVSLGG